eukprot:TRINITY_DN1972_c0_g1_i1.p1 TRINITY_DN1972_c0_g1~~TRINITY_DN1972_c0_g1_i1.p1  ORF type:complete len:421 (+),score=60.90 TRINITY_DN1972_c0_g1_i1:335-1597(+)
MAPTRADKKHVVVGALLLLVGALAIVGLARDGMYIGHLQGWVSYSADITFGMLVWRQCDNVYKVACSEDSYDDKISLWSDTGRYYQVDHSSWIVGAEVLKAVGIFCMLLFLLQLVSAFVGFGVSMRLAFVGSEEKAARWHVHLSGAQLCSTIAALVSGLLVVFVWVASFPYADMDKFLWMAARYPYAPNDWDPTNGWSEVQFDGFSKRTNFNATSCAIEAPAHGTVFPLGGSVPVGSYADYWCSAGFELKGSDTRLCTIYGLSGRQPVCQDPNTLSGDAFKSASLSIDSGIGVQIPALMLSVAALVIYFKMQPMAAVGDNPPNLQDVTMVSAGVSHDYPVQVQQQTVSWPGSGGDLAGPVFYPHPPETGAEQAAPPNLEAAQPSALPGREAPGVFSFCPRCGTKGLPVMPYCHHCGLQLR